MWGRTGITRLIGIDANEPFPVICPASPCPAIYPATFPAALAGTPVPAGTYYVPTATEAECRRSPTPGLTSPKATVPINALQVDLNHRFSNGFILRGVYTWSKTIDDGDSLNATTSGGEPALVSNPFNLRATRGWRTSMCGMSAVISGTYALPFGRATSSAGGWTLNSIVTLQGGFPFTPQLSYNPSNNGDTRNPVRPFVNPAFTRPGDCGQSESVVQSGGFPGASERQRFCGQSGARYADRAGPGDVGFFAARRTMPIRERTEAAVPGGVLQRSEPCELQSRRMRLCSRLRAFRRRRA